MAKPVIAGFAIWLFGNPGGGVGICDELAHVAAGKAEGRLEAELLDGVELGEVCGAVEAVEHKDRGQGSGIRDQGLIQGKKRTQGNPKTLTRTSKTQSGHPGAAVGQVDAGLG